MNTPKILAAIGAAALTIAAFTASIKLGVVVLLAVLVLARLVRGPSASGGIVGVEQQSQARGRRPRTGNGGTGVQTFRG
jgi:hypothetical protein